MSDEQQRVKLAPSGITAHNHEVELSESGSLALYWTWNNQEHLRAFTTEETYNLLQFLSQHRSEIEQGYAEWGKPKCMECGKPLSSDEIYTHTTVGVRFVYCADCYRSQFD